MRYGSNGRFNDPLWSILRPSGERPGVIAPGRISTDTGIPFRHRKLRQSKFRICSVTIRPTRTVSGDFLAEASSWAIRLRIAVRTSFSALQTAWARTVRSSLIAWIRAFVSWVTERNPRLPPTSSSRNGSRTSSLNVEDDPKYCFAK